MEHLDRDTLREKDELEKSKKFCARRMGEPKGVNQHDVLPTPKNPTFPRWISTMGRKVQMKLVLSRAGKASDTADYDLVLVHSADKSSVDSTRVSNVIATLPRSLEDLTGEIEPSAIYLVMGEAIFQKLASEEWRLIGTGEEPSEDRIAHAIELFRRTVGPRTCMIHDLRYKFAGDSDFPDRLLRASQFGELAVIGTGVALATDDDERLQAVTLPPVLAGEAAPVMGLSVSTSAKEVDLGAFVVRPSVGWMILNKDFWQVYDSVRFSEWCYVNALELVAKAGTLCEIPHYGRQFDCASDLGRLLLQFEMAFGNEKLREGIFDFLAGYQFSAPSERSIVFARRGHRLN